MQIYFILKNIEFDVNDKNIVELIEKNIKEEHNKILITQNLF